MQNIFNLAITERIPDVKHHCQADNFGRSFKAFEQIFVGHSQNYEDFFDQSSFSDNTFSKDITERLKLNDPACCAYPIEPPSVGKRHKIILRDALQHTPNQELILCVARSWKWYQDLTKGGVRSLQELAKNEQVSVETITRNLPLASLTPDQVERLLKGQHAPDLSVAKLIKNHTLL